MHIRRLRPTEYRMVLRLLESDADDVEELAKNIVRALNRMRAGEQTWVRVVRDGTGYLMYGPYASAEEARGDDRSVGTRPVSSSDIRCYSLHAPWGQALQEIDDRERGEIA